ncbi:MAG: alpha/beta hydrolase domain-containing protein [Vicinamibacterales bacterium]
MPFARELLRTLYTTPDDYIRAVTASVSRLVLEGFIVKEDGDDLIATATKEASTLLR